MRDQPTIPKLAQLNIIRAIASFAVAVFHLGGKKLPLLNYGWLGVEMFFILSGFIICWAMPANYKLKMLPTFLLKRMLRIEPPYMISILLVVVISILLGKSSADFDFVNLLRHLAYINNLTPEKYISPVYWTLGIEFQFYLLVGLTFQYINKSVWSLLLLICSTFLIFVNLPGIHLFANIVYFIFGIVIFLHKKLALNSLVSYLLMSYCLVLIAYRFGLPPFLVCLATAIIILFVNSSLPIVDFFSKISFSLYLTHDIIGSNLSIWLQNHLPTHGLLLKATSFTIGLASAIGFAYLFYIAIEKPCLYWSKKITYTKKSLLLNN